MSSHSIQISCKALLLHLALLAKVPVTLYDLIPKADPITHVDLSQILSSMTLLPAR